MDVHNFADTVEPLDNGQVGALTLVHYSEGVLYWGVLVKAFQIFTGRIIEIYSRDGCRVKNFCIYIIIIIYINGK